MTDGLKERFWTVSAFLSSDKRNTVRLQMFMKKLTVHTGRCALSIEPGKGGPSMLPLKNSRRAAVV